MMRHVAVYFSIVLLNACWASLVSLSTSVSKTTRKVSTTGFGSEKDALLGNFVKRRHFHLQAIKLSELSKGVHFSALAPTPLYKPMI